MSKLCLTTNLFKTDSFWKNYIWVSIFLLNQQKIAEEACIKSVAARAFYKA
jgi:hypothetical protein